MKRASLTFFLMPLMLVACNRRPIDMPVSPFDNYEPIGIETEFPDLKLEPVSSDEYEMIKNNLAPNNYQGDQYASWYSNNRQQRDLKRAYFGSQEPALCSSIENNIVLNRYSDPMSIEHNNLIAKTQHASGQVITDKTERGTYKIKDSSASSYYTIESVKRNDGKPRVTKSASIPYDDDLTIFGLKPYALHIAMHFSESFHLFGDNVVYGKATQQGQTQYLIKEAYSHFEDYSTTSHTYKAVDNYFYEGILEPYTPSDGSEVLVFTSFRFYTEKLILSEPADSPDVPVLYLERPMLVQFDESQYKIKYEILKPNPEPIPEPEE